VRRTGGASSLAKSLFQRGADFTAAMVFMFASTNLVAELGIAAWLLIGWQFTLAEFAGGAIMIVLLGLLLPRLVPRRLVSAARERLDRSVADRSGDAGHHYESEGRPPDGAGDFLARRPRSGKTASASAGWWPSFATPELTVPRPPESAPPEPVPRARDPGAAGLLRDRDHSRGTARFPAAVTTAC
jgi:uncharacterized membrane protein YraQ (UPF0718 family)